MLPRERELVGQWKDRPFSLVAVNSDQGGPEALRKILKDNDITWRNAAEGSTTAPLPKAWNVHAWPTLYLLDAEGVIRWKGHSGEWEETAEEWMKGLKSRKPGDPASAAPDPGPGTADPPPGKE